MWSDYPNFAETTLFGEKDFAETTFSGELTLNTSPMFDFGVQT